MVTAMDGGSDASRLLELFRLLFGFIRYKQIQIKQPLFINLSYDEIYLALTSTHFLYFDWQLEDLNTNRNLTETCAISTFASFERGHLNIGQNLFSI